MATATRIEIRRAEAAEAATRTLAAIHARLDAIEAKLDELLKSLPVAERIAAPKPKRD